MGIPITFMRSSSYSQWRFCQQSFYITYNLGLENNPRWRTMAGTMCHAVCEIRAKIKKCKQDGGTHIESESIGVREVIEIEAIPVDKLVEEVFWFYAKANTWYDWSVKELKMVKGWVNKVLTDNGGDCDPYNQEIFFVEQGFDLELPYEWAKYSYDIWDADKQDYVKMNGFLRCRGTMDLVIKEGPDSLAIWDYKTGERKNWTTGKKKEYEDLQEDFQLNLYYYAIRRMYPEYKYVSVNIYFIRDGGVFTFAFDDSDMKKTENMIRDRFEEIKNTNVPSLNKGFQCTKFCFWGLNKLKGSNRSICDEINTNTIKYGLKNSTEKYTKPGHTIGFYRPPGSA